MDLCAGIRDSVDRSEVLKGRQGHDRRGSIVLCEGWVSYEVGDLSLNRARFALGVAMVSYNCVLLTLEYRLVMRVRERWDLPPVGMAGTVVEASGRASVISFCCLLVVAHSRLTSPSSMCYGVCCLAKATALCDEDLSPVQMLSMILLALRLRCVDPDHTGRVGFDVVFLLWRMDLNHVAGSSPALVTLSRMDLALVVEAYSASCEA